MADSLSLKIIIESKKKIPNRAYTILALIVIDISHVCTCATREFTATRDNFNDKTRDSESAFVQKTIRIDRYMRHKNRAYSSADADSKVTWNASGTS